MDNSSRVQLSSTDHCLWETMRTRSRVELTLKKAACVIVAVALAAILGYVCYLACVHAPPFFQNHSLATAGLSAAGGVITMLGVLGIRYFKNNKVEKGMGSGYLIPSISRTAAWVLFGPLVYAMNHVDWTKYYDEYKAHDICQAFIQAESIGDVMENNALNGSDTDNLFKFGILPNEAKIRFKEMLREYRELKGSEKESPNSIPKEKPNRHSQQDPQPAVQNPDDCRDKIEQLQTTLKTGWRTFMRDYEKHITDLSALTGKICKEQKNMGTTGRAALHFFC